MCITIMSTKHHHDACTNITIYLVNLISLLTLLNSKNRNLHNLKFNPIMGLFDFFKNKTKNIVNYQTLKPLNLTDIKTQKEGYLKLVNLCLCEKHRIELTNLIDTLKDYNGDENYMTTLNFFKKYLDNKSIHFIMGLDWKQEIRDLNWRIKSSLKDNFGETVELPNPEIYGLDKSISYKNVFIDFENAINKKGYKLGFIHTDGDEYVFVVHKQADEKEIENAINMIGYNYLTATSPIINPDN